MALTADIGAIMDEIRDIINMPMVTNLVHIVRLCKLVKVNDKIYHKGYGRCKKAGAFLL